MSENLQLVQKIAASLYERKAQNIMALDVRGLTVICDYMIIASGRNVNQVKSLADEVDNVMAQEGCAIRRVEGLNEGRWVVLDYATVLIHLFHQDERSFYNLERLWNDGQNQIELHLDQTAED